MSSILSPEGNADATVSKHNSNAKVKKIKDMDQYKWDIKSNLDSAPYMLLIY